jgi:hypothetical protein
MGTTVAFMSAQLVVKRPGNTWFRCDSTAAFCKASSCCSIPFTDGRTTCQNGLPPHLSSGHPGEEENEEDREERRRRRRARKEREQADGELQLEGAHQPRDAGDRGPGQQRETLGEEKAAGGEGHRGPDSKHADGQDAKESLYKEEAIGEDKSKERKVFNESGLAEGDGNMGEGEDEREERRRRKEEKRRRHKEKKEREKEQGEGGLEGAEESEREDRYRKRRHRRDEREGSQEVPADAIEAGAEELRERKRHKRRDAGEDERSASGDEMAEKEVLGSPERGRDRGGKGKRAAEETLNGGNMVSGDIQEPGKDRERASGVRREEVKDPELKSGAGGEGEDEEEGAGGDGGEEDRRERKRRRKHRHRSEEEGDEEREARRERRRERKRRKYAEREEEMEGDGDQNDGEMVKGRGEAQNEDEKEIGPVSRASRGTHARDADTTASADKHDYDRSASRHARTETEPTSKKRFVGGKSWADRDLEPVDDSDRHRGQEEEPGRESRSDFEAKLRRRAERFGALEPMQKQLPRGSTIERDASEHRSERRQRGQRELSSYTTLDSDIAAADPVSGFRDLDRPEEEPPHPSEIEPKEDGLRTKRKRQGGKENGTDEGGAQGGRNWNEVKFRIPGVGGRAEVIDGAGQDGSAKRRVIGRPAEVKHLSIPRIGAFCPGPETAAAFRQQMVGFALCWHASILACRLPVFRHHCSMAVDWNLHLP